MINIHINNTLYIVKSRDDLVLKFLPSGCPGDAPQRFGALGCGEPHRATGRENGPWMSHVGPIFRSCFDVFFGCSKKKIGATKNCPPKKNMTKGWNTEVSVTSCWMFPVGMDGPKRFWCQVAAALGLWNSTSFVGNGLPGGGRSGKHSAANLLGGSWW